MFPGRTYGLGNKRRATEHLDLTEVVGTLLGNFINKPMQKKNSFEFLTASRFWALVIGAVMFYLKTKGFIGEAEMVLANTILGGFIITRTIDRASEQKVRAAELTGKVTTVSMPSDVSEVTAKTK